MFHSRAVSTGLSSVGLRENMEYAHRFMMNHEAMYFDIYIVILLIRCHDIRYNNVTILAYLLDYFGIIYTEIGYSRL